MIPHGRSVNSSARSQHRVDRAGVNGKHPRIARMGGIAAALVLATTSGLACGRRAQKNVTCDNCATSLAQESTVQWQELGPMSMGGRVSAVAVDPSNPQHLVVGTPAGGLWQSLDGAATWSASVLWLAAVPISAVAIHPQDPNTMVVGTGALDDGGAVHAAMGIIRTTDGGLNWSVASLPQTATGAFISSVLIWPDEPSRVLAAADVGALLSTDGGASFEQPLHGDGISLFVRDPFNPNAVFAAGRAQLFHSADRGVTWTALSGWPLLPTDNQGAGTVALAASGQTPGLLYATVQVLASAGRTARAMFLRSTDGGNTFTALAAPVFCPGALSCGFAQALALDPSNDQRLLLAGDALYASDDAGNTWNDVGAEVFGVHDLAFSTQGTFAVGKAGVVLLDPTWTTATPRNQGLAVTSIVDLDVDERPPGRLLAATGESGTLLGVGSDVSWSLIYGAHLPAGPARFDPFTPNRLYVSGQQGLLFRSDDGGNTFNAITNGLDMTQNATGVAPFEPSRLVPDTLYTGRMQLFQSLNGGDAWAPFRPPGSPEIARIAPSPLRAGRIYFSLATGPTIYKADNISTEVLSPSTNPALQVQSIFPDPSAENVLYAAGTSTDTQQGHVFKSYDFGVSWADITPPGLPPATSVVKDQFGALYVGTAGGVWRSGNDGFSWAPFNENLWASRITQLRVTPDHLYAATQGRGVFRIKVGRMVSIETIPPGASLIVDGQPVTGPVFEAWDEGTVHTVEPQLVQTDDIHQEFVGWSDGGPATHSITVPSGNLSLVAAIRVSYRLRTSVTPDGAGSIDFEPESTDGFYPSQTLVNLIATAGDTQLFSGWSGDIGGSDDLLGVVVMDRPRTVSAQFSPLSLTVQADPKDAPILVDGNTLSAPTSFLWPVGSVHTLSAPELVDTDPTDPAVLAWDSWSDLLPREHPFTMRRDGFIADFTAQFIKTVNQINLPANGIALLRSPGAADGARWVSMQTSSSSTPPPEAAAVVRGTVGGTETIDWVVVPKAAQLQQATFIEAGGPRGTTRLLLHNPGSTAAVVDVALTDATGATVASHAGAWTIPPSGLLVANLSDALPLDTSYQGLLILKSAQPVIAQVQSVRQNLRPTTFLDPIVLAPFTSADRGVPASPEVQVLLPTAGTQERLVLYNPGSATSTSTGMLALRDATGAPVAFTSQGSDSASYALAPGGYAAFDFSLASGAALTTVRMELTGQGGPPVQVQLVEERTFGPDAAGNGPWVLPRTVPPSRLDTQFAVWIDGQGRDNGLVLTNLTDADVTVTWTQTAATGQPGSTGTRVVPAHAQVALFASDLLGASASSAGVIAFSSPTALFGVGVLRTANARGEEILAGWPAFNGQPPDPTLRFPALVDGDSWSTDLWLRGSATSGPAVLQSLGRNGETLRLPWNLP